jgi:hypothetical protein
MHGSTISRATMACGNVQNGLPLFGWGEKLFWRPSDGVPRVGRHGFFAEEQTGAS